MHERNHIDITTLLRIFNAGHVEEALKHPGIESIDYVELSFNVPLDAASVTSDPPSGTDGIVIQDEFGNLPFTCPTYRGGGGPAWSGFCITLPWELYERYGDKRILAESFPTVQRWLTFLDTKADSDILRRWGGQWDFLGDWLWPGAEGVNGDTRETLFFNNCYWIHNLTTAAGIDTDIFVTDQAFGFDRSDGIIIYLNAFIDLKFHDHLLVFLVHAKLVYPSNF